VAGVDGCSGIFAGSFIALLGNGNHHCLFKDYVYLQGIWYADSQDEHRVAGFETPGNRICSPQWQDSAQSW